MEDFVGALLFVVMFFVIIAAALWFVFGLNIVVMIATTLGGV